MPGLETRHTCSYKIPLNLSAWKQNDELPFAFIVFMLEMYTYVISITNQKRKYLNNFI